MGGRILRINLCATILTVFLGTLCHAAGQVTQKLARKIMGKSFLGVEEVTEHFGIHFTDEELAAVRNVPFRESTLRHCKGTHILFLGVEQDREGKLLTIQRLRELFPPEGQPCFQSYPRLSQIRDSYAAEKTPRLQWYLIARNLRDESRSVPYWQQKQLLKENEYRERAIVYVYMMLFTFKARGERLFEKDLVWCEDVGSDGAPVATGYFRREGLYVSDWWVDRDQHIGLAPARKADLPSP